MAKPRQVNRQTTFACLSVSAAKISGRKEKEIIEAFKKNGWGVLAEENRYRFIHFDENVTTDVSSILSSIVRDNTGWSAYRLSFPDDKAAKMAVSSAEWK